MSTALFDPIKTMSKLTDSVVVGLSTGKESVVTLDLCCRYFKNVSAYHMYICKNLGFVERTLQWYENKYGIEVLRLPHPDLCEFFHYGSFRPGDESFPIMSFNEAFNYIRVTTDTFWIACGERAKDSVFRLGLINTAGSIDENRGRFYPLAQWNKKEVLEYIKHHRLKLGEESRYLGSSFYGLHGKCLIQIKKHFPEDYEKLLHLYPFAEAGVKREEERLLRGDNYYSKKY